MIFVINFLLSLTAKIKKKKMVMLCYNLIESNLPWGLLCLQQGKDYPNVARLSVNIIRQSTIILLSPAFPAAPVSVWLKVPFIVGPRQFASIALTCSPGTVQRMVFPFTYLYEFKKLMLLKKNLDYQFVLFLFKWKLQYSSRILEEPLCVMSCTTFPISFILFFFL